MSGRFDGRVVLLSGATGGFGRAAAAAFAAEGARLVLTDLDGDRLAALAAELPAESEVMAGDVADPGLHRALVAAAQNRFGKLDVAVNNAGIANPLARLEAIPEDEVRRVIEIDLIAVIWALQAQVPAMDVRNGGGGGAIVNVSSLAGIRGAALLAAYVAAKHGVVGLTRAAALENARRGIRVNAVCPAYARTAMVEEHLLPPGEDAAAAEAQLTRGVPMRRMAETAEIAAAILFAADPANGFMTGETLAADGGISAG